MPSLISEISAFAVFGKKKFLSTSRMVACWTYKVHKAAPTRRWNCLYQEKRHDALPLMEYKTADARKRCALYGVTIMAEPIIKHMDGHKLQFDKSDCEAIFDSQTSCSIYLRFLLTVSTFAHGHKGSNDRLEAFG